MSKEFKICLCYFVALLAFVIVRMLNLYGVFSSIKGWNNEILLSLIIQVVCLIILPYFIYKILTREKIKTSLKFFGYKKISFKSVIICVLLGIIAYLMNICVSTIFNGILEHFNYFPRTQYVEEVLKYSNWGYFLLGIFLSAVLPAICEEFLHRGFLLRGIEDNHNFTTALIYSSILFGLFHLNIYQTFYAIFLGFLMGYLVKISGSIFPAMIIHFMNNAINIYFTFAQETNKLGANLFKDLSNFLTTNYTVAFISLSAVICLILALFVYLIFALLNEEKLKKQGHHISTIDLILVMMSSKVVDEKTDIDFVALTEDEKLIYKIKSHLATCFPKKKSNSTFKDKIFLYCSMFLGIIVTVFTFLWGVM